MKPPLSISGYKKYTTCPKMYEYHYIEKDRPGGKTSALLFGSIMDDVINSILLNKITDPYLELSIACSKAVNEDVEFYLDDLDVDLETKNWEGEAKKLGWKGRDLNPALKTFLKEQSTLSDKQKQLLRIAIWDCLEQKGIAMIDAFIAWFLPKVDTIHEVQKHLTSDNNGRPIHGFLDFTCTLKDGRKVLFDLKTAKMSYKNDAVLKSPQLALYTHIENYEYAGYVVLVKTLSKNKKKECLKCGEKYEGGNIKNCKECKEQLQVKMKPTSYCQILVDKVPQRNKDLTINAMSDVIDCINKKQFHRNLDACGLQFGKPCVYIDKCWKTKENK